MQIMTANQTPQSLAQAPMPQVDSDRKRMMRDAWVAYKGELQKPLKVEKDQPDDNVLANRCAPIVDKGVSFLFGQVVKIEAEDEKDAEGETGPIQEFIDGMWGDDDRRMTLLTEIAMNGGICGQCFVKLTPPRGQMKYPGIVNLDPQNLRIVTDPEDSQTILAFVTEYPVSDGWQKRQIIARVDPNRSIDLWGDNDPDDYWTITNYVRYGPSGEWRQLGEQTIWSYPFSPIITWKNLPNPNEPWGLQDLTIDLIGVNKSINFLQSCISRILKYHGHPKTIATGTRMEQVNISIDGVICLEAPDADIKNLEMVSDLSTFLNFLTELRSNMDEQSRVPAVALGRLADLPKGQISGVALQLLFQPLLEKTTLKRRLYGTGIREVTRAALVLAGKIPVESYEDYGIDLHWPGLLPVDSLEEAQLCLLLEKLGASRDTLLQRLNLDPDKEAEKKRQEEEEEQERQITAYSQGRGLPPPNQMMQQQANAQQIQQPVGGRP